VAWLLAAVASSAASAQLPPEAVPPEFEGVGINDRRGEVLPLDLEFVDQEGRTVRVGDYFGQGKPVLLTPVYYQCPMLCNLTLNGLIDALKEIDWTAGDEFTILTVSFNPQEGAKLAEVKRRAYLSQYPREGAGSGWHFLTGNEAGIRALMDAAGFGYRRDTATGEYAHPSTVIFCTPEGRISLYLNDVAFEPRDVRLGLVEASVGGIGSPLDQFALFFCFQYDPDSNSYVVAAWKLMRAFGLVVLMAVAGGLGLLWLREMRRSHQAVALPREVPS
jgi:protein SCO1/2